MHNAMSNQARAENRQMQRKEHSDDKVQLKAVNDLLDQRDQEIKAFAEKANKEIKEHGTILADTKTVLDGLVKDGLGLQDRLQDIEQKLARRFAANDPTDAKSVGEELSDSEDFKALQTRGRGIARIGRKYDSAGTKVNAVTSTGLISDLLYDGTDFILVDPLPVAVAQRRQSLRGAAINWKASANGISANIVCSADSVVLANTAGDSTVVDAITLTLNTAVAASATVDGMASGAVAANTWYGIYVWMNSATGVKRITGDSAYTTGLAPTPPAAGFDLWARRGAFRTDNTANRFVYGFTQTDDLYSPKVATGANVPDLPIVVSGVAGNPTVPTTWVSVPIAGVLAGPSAVSVRLSTMISNGAAIAVAPNGAYSGTNSASTDIGAPAGGVGQATAFLVVSVSELLLEGSNFNWASSGAIGRVRFAGWRDAL